MEFVVYSPPRVFSFVDADQRDLYRARYDRDFRCSKCMRTGTRLWFRVELTDDPEYDDLVCIGSSCEIEEHFPPEDAEMAA